MTYPHLAPLSLSLRWQGLKFVSINRKLHKTSFDHVVRTPRTDDAAKVAVMRRNKEVRGAGSGCVWGGKWEGGVSEGGGTGSESEGGARAGVRDSGKRRAFYVHTRTHVE